MEVASVETTPVEPPAVPTLPVPPKELQPPGSASIEPAPAAGVAPAPTHARQTQVVLLAGPPPEAGTQGTAKVLSEAIRALRAQHSPGAALLLLDRNANALGKSAFAHEALLLRVEALLALGRKGEVLRILDGAVLTDVAASRSPLGARADVERYRRECPTDPGLRELERQVGSAK
jgi:hypothetical protein